MIDIKDVKITAEDIAGVIHESLVGGYANHLRVIQREIGISDEVAKTIIKEANRGIKDTFLAAVRKLEKAGAAKK